jgi:hypothetical protein
MMNCSRIAATAAIRRLTVKPTLRLAGFASQRFMATAPVVISSQSNRDWIALALGATGVVALATSRQEQDKAECCGIAGVVGTGGYDAR